MADLVWKGVHPLVFGLSNQLSRNKFFDPSTPSMRKDRDGEEEKNGKKEKTDENSGHYVVASSRPPERQPLERRTLAPISSQVGVLVLVLVAGGKQSQLLHKPTKVGSASRSGVWK